MKCSVCISREHISSKRLVERSELLTPIRTELKTSGRGQAYTRECRSVLPISERCIPVQLLVKEHNKNTTVNPISFCISSYYELWTYGLYFANDGEAYSSFKCNLDVDFAEAWPREVYTRPCLYVVVRLQCIRCMKTDRRTVSLLCFRLQLN